MRSTTARPGIAGDARQSVKPAMRLCSKLQKHETAFTHLPRTTEPYIRKSDFVPMHKSRLTYLRQAVHPQINKKGQT